jgi:hypothetical protein
LKEECCISEGVEQATRSDQVRRIKKPSESSKEEEAVFVFIGVNSWIALATWTETIRE